MKNCLVCQRIQSIKEGTNSNFVCELKTSYVVLGDSQFYKGYTLLLSKTHCTELHHLDIQTRFDFLHEMAIVAEAVYTVCQPQKINYELLGNKHPHLHWHIFPRYKDDPNPLKPIWQIDEGIRNNTFLPEEERVQLILELRNEIRKTY